MCLTPSANMERKCLMRVPCVLTFEWVRVGRSVKMGRGGKISKDGLYFFLGGGGGGGGGGGVPSSSHPMSNAVCLWSKGYSHQRSC